MQALLFSAGLLSLMHPFAAQDYFGVPPFPYHHGHQLYHQPPSYHQGYEQQAYHPQDYQPSGYPPHFRPLGFPQDPYKSPYFQDTFPHHEPTFSNDLTVRSHLPNPYMQDYPNLYQFPQYDETYPDLDYNKVPALREPVQIVPSRFPPRVESWVEKIQNRFSIYNPAPPGTLPHGPTVIFIAKPNDTDSQVGLGGPMETTPAPVPDVSSTEPSADGSSTENSSEPMAENTTDTIEASNENRINIENVTDSNSNDNPEVTTEAATDDTTEATTQSK